MQALTSAASRTAGVAAASSSPLIVLRPGVGRSSSRVAPCRALKRVIQPAYFQEVFPSAAERVFIAGGFLKREETLVLVESCRTLEHAFKTLDLIVRHLENRAGAEINDWHHRKKYYMRLCELSLRMERGPDVIFALFGNIQRFKIATYFAKEVIERLGALGAHPGILLRIADLSKLQLGPQDKGVRAAFTEVVSVLEARNSPLDQEFLPKAKAAWKSLRHATTLKTDVPAVPPAQPALAPAAAAEVPQSAVQEPQGAVTL